VGMFQGGPQLCIGDLGQGFLPVVGHVHILIRANYSNKYGS
jgi:hypothetical protein